MTFWEDHKQKILFGITILIISTIFVGIAFFKYHMLEKYANPQQPPSMNISLDGKPSKVSDPQVVYLQGQNIITKEIVYTQKEIDPVSGEKEKTDVQLERKENKVYVKVNGSIYEVPVEVTEDTTFENGKLVVTETSKTDVNITGPDPAKWSLSYLRDIKGTQAAEISYGFNKLIKGKVLFIEKQSPMFGIEVSLGDLQSKSAPKINTQKQ